MDRQDFLLEIGCDELPARFLKQLSLDLVDVVSAEIKASGLTFSHYNSYATPRRLAVVITGLDSQQEDQLIERHGPFLKDAYDKNGTPTLACIGFAKSCGVSVDELKSQSTEKGERVCVLTQTQGASTLQLLPAIMEHAIKKLPLPKPMRWEKNNISFLRPVQWVVMLFGKELVHTTLLGKQTTHATKGHRFHCPHDLFIESPGSYETTLESQGVVIPDFEKRKELILTKLQKEDAHTIIDPALLEEVTGLVEYPTVLKGNFNPLFLTLPQEVLITTLKVHQKCFPVRNQENKLVPHFLLVSNIDSTDPKKVIIGNERVIHARLSDAMFFYRKDCKVTLESRLNALDHIIFQNKLGSIGNKIKRVSKLALELANTITQADSNVVKRAVTLSKCDLVSNMVFEFPQLQGIMGYYYALHDQEPLLVAEIIKEHYLPKFSGDALPSSQEALCVALADRIDTLVGIIGIKQKPTGDKDPFALRRIAQGIYRIIIEKQLDIDLLKFIEKSIRFYDLFQDTIKQEIFQFILERMKYGYLDKGVSPEIFEAVAATHVTNLLDFDKRIHAVLAFQKLNESTTLIALNKRIHNILKKQNDTKITTKIAPHLLELDAEKALFDIFNKQTDLVTPLYESRDYTKVLSSLITLDGPIARFFEEVMVLDENEKKRNNRLALLRKIFFLLSMVVDITRL